MNSVSIQKGIRIEGQTALVTGGGRGLGAAIAKTLALAGASVIVMSRSKDQLQEVVADIQKAGGNCRAVACDVTRNEELRRAIDGLPPLDILVNNAGTNFPGPFTAVTDEQLDTMLNLNVRAAFVAAQAVVKKMLAHGERAADRGGVIVNVSSQMGHVGALNRTAYVMTKHALEGLTKAMAVELAPKNIRVVSIAPTFVDTPMTRLFFQDEKFKKWVYDRIPMGRLLTPDEVADSVLFLVSPAARMITGTSLVIDGGWTAQ